MMTDPVAPARVYIDTNVFIYFLEFDDDLHRLARARIASFREAGVEIVISRLTFLECIYGASKAGDTAVVDLYRSMLTRNPAIGLIEMTSDILERAALNGGSLGLRLADAIHYFTALHCGCDLFLTNDRRFKLARSMQVEHLSAAN